MRSNCTSIRRVLTCLQKDSWSASCVYLFIFYSLEFPLRPHQQIFTRKYIHCRFSRKTFLELNTWVKYNYIYIQNIENKLHCSLFYGNEKVCFWISRFEDSLTEIYRFPFIPSQGWMRNLEIACIIVSTVKR